MMLHGKNAVITGCLKGIGRATLDAFASEGANIWACCQEYSEQFEKHINEQEDRYSIWIKPIYFDFSDENQIKSAVKQIRADKKNIDSLINIVGITKDAHFHMVSMKDMRNVFEVNFFSQILFTQYITKIMLRQNTGSVIFTSSISGIDGNIGQLTYASSKAAIIAATKTLSAELGPNGIRVNAVAPGVVDTDMTKGVKGESLQNLVELSDLKRLGLPEDIAGTILFLASDYSSYVTGQVLRIDGGIR
jgi:3-oxoacyl-[acyl-carrier protein] reductase